MQIRVDRYLSTDEATLSRVYVDGAEFCAGLEDAYRAAKIAGRLFGMPDLNDVIDETGILDVSLGEMVQRLTQTVELQAIHIERLREALCAQPSVQAELCQ